MPNRYAVLELATRLEGDCLNFYIPLVLPLNGPAYNTILKSPKRPTSDLQQIRLTIGAGLKKSESVKKEDLLWPGGEQPVFMGGHPAILQHEINAPGITPNQFDDSGRDVVGICHQVYSGEVVGNRLPVCRLQLVSEIGRLGSAQPRIMHIVHVSMTLETIQPDLGAQSRQSGAYQGPMCGESLIRTQCLLVSQAVIGNTHLDSSHFSICNQLHGRQELGTNILYITIQTGT